MGEQRRSVRVAIVGVGNCAASLVQGVVNSVPFQSRMAQSLPERLGDVP